jgi:hypothetical protein
MEASNPFPERKMVGILQGHNILTLLGLEIPYFKTASHSAVSLSGYLFKS